MTVNVCRRREGVGRWFKAKGTTRVNSPRWEGAKQVCEIEVKPVWLELNTRGRKALEVAGPAHAGLTPGRSLGHRPKGTGQRMKGFKLGVSQQQP